jgi:hypothetical protein
VTLSLHGLPGPKPVLLFTFLMRGARERRQRRGDAALLKGGGIVAFFVCAFLARSPPASRVGESRAAHADPFDTQGARDGGGELQRRDAVRRTRRPAGVDSQEGTSTSARTPPRRAEVGFPGWPPRVPYALAWRWPHLQPLRVDSMHVTYRAARTCSGGGGKPLPRVGWGIPSTASLADRWASKKCHILAAMGLLAPSLPVSCRVRVDSQAHGAARSLMTSALWGVESVVEEEENEEWADEGEASCASGIEGDVPDVCAFVREFCTEEEGLLDYLHFHYCTMRGAEAASATALVLVVLATFYLLGETAEEFFCPVVRSEPP